MSWIMECIKDGFICQVTHTFESRDSQSLGQCSQLPVSHSRGGSWLLLARVIAIAIARLDLHPCRRGGGLPGGLRELETNQTSILRHLDYLNKKLHLPAVGPVTQGRPSKASRAATRVGGCGVFQPLG